MGAITGTKIKASELAGDTKIYIATCTPASASDTITFVAATHKFRTIFGVWAQIESGLDANFTLLQVSFSGLVVTIVSKKADGTTSADDWTGVVIRLLIVTGSAG